MKSLALASVLFASIALAPETASAQRATLVLENDVIARTDRDYTQGFRGSVIFDDLSKDELIGQTFDVVKLGLFPIGAASGPKRSQLEIIVGQSIFTPDKLSGPVWRNGSDRPFGGWLYTGVAASQETAKTQLDSFEFLAGVVGPASLSSQVQDGFHSLLGEQSKPELGYKIRNEPGFVASWDRRWKLGVDLGDGYGFDVIPSAGLTAGNVFTYGSAGAIFRYGRGLSSSWGPTRVRPASSGASFFSPDPAAPWLGFAVFAGVEGRAVARNIFLDGNTFVDSPHVTKKPLVADLIAGAEMFTQTGARVAFTVIYRTREYTTQAHDAIFGSVEATLPF